MVSVGKIPDPCNSCTDRCGLPEFDGCCSVACLKNNRGDRAKPRFPTDPKIRKGFPVFTGVLDYFPDAIMAVAAVSKAGNEQHNPGEELHWARGKSMDQADTVVRHLMERGTVDTDGHRHSAKAAWRTLALLQLEIEEAEGLPPSRGSK